MTCQRKKCEIFFLRGGFVGNAGETPYTGVEDETDLGYVIAEDWTIPEYLVSYIDYEAIGRDFTCSGWTLYDGLAICRG